MATDVNTWLLYGFLVAVGLFTGILITFRSYAGKVEDVLNDLKSLGEITQERYEYFIKRYVTNQNKLKGVGSVWGKVKERRSKRNV